MPDYLIDSDAFLCIRSLSILAALGDAAIPIAMGGIVRHRELSALDALLAALETRGLLRVNSVMARTPEHLDYQRLVRSGVDKGEAEAVAWAARNGPDITFVSLDRRARAAAASERVTACDVIGFAVRLARWNGLAEAELHEKLAPWEDDHFAFGCTKDFVSVAVTWAARASQLPA